MQASIFHIFDCVLPPQTSYTSSTMMHCRAGTMSPEVCTKPSTSEATVSSGISAVCVCQVHRESKATEYSSYHISPRITVTPKSSKHGPGSPERSISTSVEQFRFSGRNFCFSSQKATRVYQQCLQKGKKKTKNKTRKAHRQALVSTAAKVPISPNNTPEVLYWASKFLYPIQRNIIQSRQSKSYFY